MGAIVIAGVVIISMIALIFFKPVMRIGKISISPYWLAPLVGALMMAVCGFVSPAQIGAGLFQQSEVNPIRILILFLSMTLISVFLDGTGFFGMLAMAALKRSGKNQAVLFLTVYFTVAVLTVFTSNDIIVLTFTPFICYFAKNARIDPLPYLVAEFVAANTWSMALMIGNPTNIYLAATTGVDFIAYLKVMLIPTLMAGLVSLGVMWFTFRRSLRKPIEQSDCPEVRRNIPLMVMGLIALGTCIVLMTVSSFLGWPMWKISLTCFLTLYLSATAVLLIARKPLSPVLDALRGAPLEIIPFILSMFIIVLALDESGVTAMASGLLYDGNPLLSYGAASFLTANLVNNIPMSVLFSVMIQPLTGLARTQALFAAVAGSNLGAFLTPIGALAGIMWMGLLRNFDVKLSFGRFIRYGAPAAVAAMAAAIAGLAVVL